MSATAPDGLIYRGRVWPDVTVASDPTAQSEPNPPVAKLDFGGGEVEYYADGGCHDHWPDLGGPHLEVVIFISAGDSSIDGAGTLHVHGAPRDGLFESGPSFSGEPTTGYWSVDLTLTAAGKLTATLSTTGPSIFFSGTGGSSNSTGAAGAGGAGGAGGDTDASSSSPDAGAVIQTITISGPVAPLCGVPGPNGETIPATIPVSGGGVFTFPCPPPAGFCDFSNG